MEKNYSVVGIGAVCLDQVSLLPNFPAEDTKVKTNSYYQQVGGPAPVALLFLNHLGIKTYLVAGVGDDQTGSFIKKSFPELTQERGRQSATAQVWINQTNGTRTIAYNRGSLSPLPKTIITQSVFNTAKILHFDGQEPKTSAEAADLAHRFGITVTYDAGDFKPQSELLLKKADVVIAPKRFGKTAEEIANFGPKIAVVTDGANGLSYCFEQKTVFLPSFKVKTVETVGAGDIFSGALIYSLLKKMPLNKGIRFASAAAAIKCSRIGRYFAAEKEIEATVEKTELI
jgi:sugar/nucleoside kinase (ribokinase family)